MRGFILGYIDMANKMQEWGQTTYAEALDGCKNLNSVVVKKTISVLQKINRLNTKMTGTSIQGLYRNEAAEKSGKVMFSTVFREASIKKEFSPAYYAYKIVEGCRETDTTFHSLTEGIVCRGLRIFPSFLREPCLEYKIQEIVPEARIASGVELDVNEHTDLLVRINGNIFRIWSYQSERLGNTIEKIKGKRGELPDGIFILCPFDRADNSCYTSISGWYMHSDEYVEKVKKFLYKDTFAGIDRYENVIVKNSNLETYMRKIQIFAKGKF